jgi:hypothetical protein
MLVPHPEEPPPSEALKVFVQGIAKHEPRLPSQMGVIEFMTMLRSGIVGRKSIKNANAEIKTVKYDVIKYGQREKNCSNRNQLDAHGILPITNSKRCVGHFRTGVLPSRFQPISLDLQLGPRRTSAAPGQVKT